MLYLNFVVVIFFGLLILGLEVKASIWDREVTGLPV